MIRSGCLVSLAALLLGGCAVGPDFTPLEAPVPAIWSEAPRASAKPARLGDWWRAFRDPALDSIIEQAVAQDLTVATARAKVREARATRRVSAAAFAPSLTGSGSASREQTPGSQSGTGRNYDYNLYSGGFDASWEIDFFGGNQRTLEASHQALRAVEDDLDAALLTLIGDVASDYIEARGLQARIALAQGTARSQRNTAALTRTKFQVGSASAVDTSKAEALAASTEATIPPFRASFDQTVHRLSVLTGQAPGALAGLMEKPRPIPSPRKALPLGLPGDLLKNRPDVRAAEKRVAQYTARIGAAEAALYPKLTITGAFSSNALRFEDFAKASTLAWSYGPSLTLPFFQGGSLTAQVDLAKATRDEYLIAWRATVLTALQNVEDDIVALSQEKLHAKKLAEATAGYAKAAELSQSLYSMGSSSYLDVLDAQRSLYSAQDSLLVSRIAIATDHVALAKALGGGWTRPVDSSAPEIIDREEGPHPSSTPPYPKLTLIDLFRP
jgi:NodT family efflux transporter outer membrane factor (OMF) lipoprotein